MVLTLRKSRYFGDNGKWDVWLSMEVGNPANRNESFIVGSGATPEAAIEHAESELRELALVTIKQLARGPLENLASVETPR